MVENSAIKGQLDGIQTKEEEKADRWIDVILK